MVPDGAPAHFSTLARDGLNRAYLGLLNQNCSCEVLLQSTQIASEYRIQKLDLPQFAAFKKAISEENISEKCYHLSYTPGTFCVKIRVSFCNGSLGTSASLTTVKLWAVEFKRGRKSLGDDELSERPGTETTDENITKGHQMVLDDDRYKVIEIAEV
ncbi:hypothetical protein TNCV_3311011 [Trichonephila clavipes]|nr:hypothetical protein TNCV_3311011 [Trichonephila clavipes]